MAENSTGKWDSTLYQGKSEDQVRSSEGIAVIALLLVLVILVLTAVQFVQNYMD